MAITNFFNRHTHSKNKVNLHLSLFSDAFPNIFRKNYLHDSLFQMFFQISFENYFPQSDESFKLINH